MKKKKPIKLKKERVILSDVLPYELPLTFSNRHLYNFLVTYKIRLEGDVLKWESNDCNIESILRILLGIGFNDNNSNISIKFNSHTSFNIAILMLCKVLWKNIFLIQFDSNEVKVLDVNNFDQKFVNNKDISKVLSGCDYERNQTNLLTFSNRKCLFSFVKSIFKARDFIIDEQFLSLTTFVRNFNNYKFKGYKRCYESIKIKSESFRNIPFTYKISHKINDFRELSIIHPFNQLELIDFYTKNKEQILYYSGISKFSMRRPDSIAKTVFYNDKLHKSLQGDESDSAEIQGKEYENLKHFFTYKSYSNIHRFFEDYRYHRAEKKYRNLFKIDITKCFDSIYTHTIVWALNNKEIVKDNLRDSLATFSGQFDKVMQNSNYGETNGILIGPEFSRIFAELILQQIDKNVEKQMREEQLFHKREYETYRYVDDTFLFYDDEAIKDRFIELYIHELKHYNLSINNEKSISYTKPMITELSIAKLKLNELFNKNFNYKIVEIDSDTEDEEKVINNKYSLYLSSNKLITKFKAIIKESNIEYKDIINYALASINRKVEGLINRFDSIIREIETTEEVKGERIEKYKEHEKKFVTALIEILDFTFFIYSVVPRVNSTIKLSKILILVINSLKKKTELDSFQFSNQNIDIVFKKIQDDITLVLEQNKLKPHTQVETLYLLSILMEMGRDYYLKKYSLASYFGFVEDKETGRLFIPKQIKLNYLSITVLLFYVKNIKEFEEIRILIKLHIIDRFNEIEKDKLVKKTEFILLLFDLLNCPYLVDSGAEKNMFKKEILTLFGVKSELQAPMLKFINGQLNWFTKWSNFNFEKEINSKISQEVYS